MIVSQLENALTLIFLVRAKSRGAPSPAIIGSLSKDDGDGDGDGNGNGNDHTEKQGPDWSSEEM